MSKWSRGSEWRKWDLHIHPPGTKLSDQYRVEGGKEELWDEYCDRIHQSDVMVFGITDYFSADGYLKTKREYQQRYNDSDKYFLCNIEFRISEIVNRANEEVNTHLIFNTSRSDHETYIQKFLQHLKTTKTGLGGQYLRASDLAEGNQFAAATTTREYILEALRNTYGRDTELLDILLIATAANNDGIRAERGQLRKEQITDEIDKFSNCFFGSTKNVEHFLRSDRGEDKAEYFEPKPVLSGCDAHSFADLDLKLGNVVKESSVGHFQPTWIKADPTFEGLKQIIFEPENRVFIGETPKVLERVRGNKTKYIERLEINARDGYTGSNGIWFKNESIPIGKELVAIIGNKGSGKSAVTDIIGLLGNSHNQKIEHPPKSPEELLSFLTKNRFLKRGYANNFVANLVWFDDSVDSRTLDGNAVGNSPEKVEYLPQKYLERICANIDDDEFRRTLNEVIFRYVPDSGRYNQSSLDGLISYLTQQAESDIERSRLELNRVNERVVSIEKKLLADHRQEVQHRIRQKEQELAALESERPEAVQKPSVEEPTTDNLLAIDRTAAEIAECTNEIAAMGAEKSRLVQDIEELGQLKAAIQREVATLKAVQGRFVSILESAELSFDEIVNVELDYGRIDEVIEMRKRRLDHVRRALATDEDIVKQHSGRHDADDAIASARAESIVCKQITLEKRKASLIDQQARPTKEYQQYLTKSAEWKSRERQIRGDAENPTQDSLNGLRKELENIKNVYPKDLRDQKLKQVEASKRIFRQKQLLNSVYEKIKQSIDSEITKFRDDLGDYSVSIEVGLHFNRSFLDDFLSYINQSKRVAFMASRKAASSCE